MDAVEIRALDADDTPEFLRLKELGLTTDPESFVASLEEDPPDYPQRVRDRLGRSSVAAGDIVLGAFAPALVGMVAVTRERQVKRRHKAKLHEMYVAPEHRGRALGYRLLVEVLEAASAMDGLEEISLIVATHNQKAAEMYRRFGFIDTWTEHHALKIGGRYVDAHHMVLR